jgi:WD40 repeat protein
VAEVVAGLRRAADERLRRAEHDKLAAQVQAGEQVKRRRAVQRAAVIVAAVLLLGVAGTTVGLIWANASRRDAIKAEKVAETKRTEADTARKAESNLRILAEDTLYLNRITLADREIAAGNLHNAEALLDLCSPDRRRWEWHYLKQLCHGELVSLAQDQNVVNVLEFSPDGQFLASGSGHPHQPGSPGIIKIWKTSTWEEVRTLRGQSVAVTSLSFSPNGERLLSAGFTIDTGKLSRGAERLEDAARGELHLWKMDTGFDRLQMPGYTCGCWKPEGLFCAGGHLAKKVVVVWDPQKGGKPLLTLPEHEGIITKIMYAPDAQWMITSWMSTAVGALARGEVSSENATKVGVKIWNARSGELALSLDGYSSAQLSHDGKRLAAVRDHVVRVWDLQQAINDGGKMPLLMLHGHTQSVNHLGFSRDGRRLATGSADKIVRIWSLETGQMELALRGHNDMVVDVRFSPDDKKLLSAGWDGTIKVWDATRDPEFRALKGHTGNVTDLAFAPDSRRLASVAPDGLRLWNVLHTKEVLHLREGYQSVALSADGKRLAAGIRPNKVRLWNLETWKEEGPPPAEVATLDGHAGRVTALAFSPNSRLLAAGSVDPQDGARPGKVILSDAATGASLREFNDLPASVLALTFRPDGQRLAVGLADGQVLIYDPATGAETARLELAPPEKGFRIPLISVAYAPDGARLATSFGNALAPDNPREIVIWDANSGARQSTVHGHSAVVNSLAFSPDGERLAAASWDMNRGAIGEVKLWDVATFTEMLTLKGHGNVAFSPDGRFLTAISSDPAGACVVKVWGGGDR